MRAWRGWRLFGPGGLPAGDEDGVDADGAGEEGAGAAEGVGFRGGIELDLAEEVEGVAGADVLGGGDGGGLYWALATPYIAIIARNVARVRQSRPTETGMRELMTGLLVHEHEVVCIPHTRESCQLRRTIFEAAPCQRFDKRGASAAAARRRPRRPTSFRHAT